MSEVSQAEWISPWPKWELISLLSTVIVLKVQLICIFNYLFMAMSEKYKSWVLYLPLRSLLSKYREVEASYFLS